jgi:hypothetical protein
MNQFLKTHEAILENYERFLKILSNFLKFMNETSIHEQIFERHNF